MARDTLQVLRSSVPLLRPADRCPGEIYVNFADRIFGYIDAAGRPQDVGPLVFPTVAALAAYDAAVVPPNGVLAFAADAFYLKEAGGTAAGLSGWRELALGGGGGGDFDDSELRALIAQETQNRIDGDSALASQIVIVSAESVAGDNALNARVTSESTARVDGDVALGIRIDNLSAGGGFDDTELRALISTESIARVAGDSALASQITTLSATVADEDALLAARITTESAARVDGDTALATRSTSLEAFRTDSRQSGGNLLQNVLSNQTDSWVFDANAWSGSPDIDGPSTYRFLAFGPGFLRANNAEYLPAPSQRLDFEVWVTRGRFTTGQIVAVLELGTAVGNPLPSLTQVLTVPDDVLTRVVFSFDLPTDGALWRMAFESTVTDGTIIMRSPFLGLRGQDYSAEINEIGARVTDESIARVQGDDALASRSTTLEAFKRDVQRNGGNLIDNSTLSIGTESWVLGAWQTATRLDAPNDEVFTLTAPGNNVLRPNDGEFRPLGFEALSLWFWMLTTAGTTGTLTAEIFAQTLGGEVSAAVQTFPLAGRDTDWSIEQFSTEMPTGATGWRVEFRGNVLSGRLEVAMPFVGFAGQDFAPELGALSARITDESVARIAGDTALATRSTRLEAESLLARASLTTYLFGVYESLEQMEAAGWEFLPPLATGFWRLVNAFPSDGGAGKAVRFDGEASIVYLLAPATPTVGANTANREEEHRIKLVVNRDGPPATAPTFTGFVGWECFDQTMTRIVTDVGDYSWQGGNDVIMAASAQHIFEGYTFLQRPVGAGNNVGGAAPTSALATPWPTRTTFVRPTFVGFFPGGAANTLSLEFQVIETARTTRERSLRASITTESIARTTADEALAQQIQTIIATEAKGTQTFFQATAPLNPEPGWLWFRDTGPGIPDEIYRWSGTVWVRIDTAQANDLSLLEASIRDESTARVAGDSALSFRSAVLEATSLAQGAEIDGLADGLVAANARVTAESQARVQGDDALASRTTSLEATVVSQGAAIGGVTQDVVTANARITQESQTRASADAALAQQTSTVESSVGGVAARVTVNEQAINGIRARYSVRVDANGRVAGIELIAGGDQSEFNVLSDVFRVFNPVSGVDEAVFEARDGRVFIREAFIPLLSTSNLKIDDVVLDTNAEGELTIKQLGVTTNLLAPNATNVAYAYSQIVGGSGATFPRNVWSTVSLNGVPATVRVTNGPIGGALVKFDVNLLVRNNGTNSDVASFRVQRSDGLILPTLYTGMYIDDTPNNAFGNQAMTFFDIGLAPGANFNYTFQMNSNEESPVRALHIFGMLFKNSQAAPFSAPLP